MALKFRGVDFIEFDALLNDEERLVRDTARRFIEDNLIPIIEECNRAGRFPRELVKPMADLGFFGASLKGFGCAGMSNVEYGLVMQELERGDSGLRSFASVQSALVMYPIYAFGSDEQKNTWLPALQKGEKLGCFGLTEPDFGSNPSGMRTRARKSGDEYVLNGEKMWITSGSIADVAVVWAKVEDEDNKIRGFLVETDRAGFRAEDIHGKWSLRASVTSSLSLQDVRVPASNLLPKSGGLKSPLMCLNQARYGIAWGAVGAAMACYDCALQYALFRKQFHDQPIASRQLVQEKLAWMITEITKRSCWRSRSDGSRTGRRPGTSTFRWPSATTSGWRSNAPAWRATSSGQTASPTNTPSSATWPTSNRSRPTRARTTSMR